MKSKIVPAIILILPICLLIGYVSISSGVFYASYEKFKGSYVHTDGFVSESYSLSASRIMDPILIETELAHLNDALTRTNTELDIMDMKDFFEVRIDDRQEATGMAETSSEKKSLDEYNDTDTEVFYVVMNQESFSGSN